LPTPLHLYFFHRTSTPDTYTLSLHDALPIYSATRNSRMARGFAFPRLRRSSHFRSALKFSSRRLRGILRAFCNASSAASGRMPRDRKSTRLNSSHVSISYAVFCLKKKKQNEQ